MTRFYSGFSFKVLVIVIVVASGLVTPIYGQNGGPSLSVENPTTHLNTVQVNVGSNFGVEIWIRNIPGAIMVSFTFYLNWSPTLMQYTSHTTNVPSGWIVNVDTANANSGMLDVHGSGSAYGTDRTWLSVSFRCLGSGSSDISISDESWMDTEGFTLSFDPISDATVTQTRNVGPPVGGFMEPANKLTIAAPYLALFGLVAAVAIIIWKKPEQYELNFSAESCRILCFFGKCNM